MKHYYYETFEASGYFGWRIFHYDETGNIEVVVFRSTKKYGTEGLAADACSEFQEDNNIDAELAGGI